VEKTVPKASSGNLCGSAAAFGEYRRPGALWDRHGAAIRLLAEPRYSRGKLVIDASSSRLSMRARHLSLFHINLFVVRAGQSLAGLRPEWSRPSIAFCPLPHFAFLFPPSGRPRCSSGGKRRRVEEDVDLSSQGPFGWPAIDVGGIELPACWKPTVSHPLGWLTEIRNRDP